MSLPDLIVFSTIEAGLVLFAFVAVAVDLINKARSKRAEMSATVTRGESTMNALYTFYGIATVVYSLAVDAATGLEGLKVGFIALDYLCLTYLFFFSSWFRNQIFFPLLRRVRED
jgi:hypothetical protein